MEPEGISQVSKKAATWYILGVGGLFAAIAWVALFSNQQPQAVPKAQVAALPVPAPETPAAAPVPESPWEYDAHPDDMGLGTLFTARTKSINTVDFSFPYQGEQRASLTVRSHPQYGKDVMVSIAKGQILIDPTDGCQALLRFDEDKPIRVMGSGPADHSSTTLFLSGFSTLVSRLKKAKTLRIQIPVYQQGQPVFEFDVTDLEWPPKSKAPNKSS